MDRAPFSLFDFDREPAPRTASRPSWRPGAFLAALALAVAAVAAAPAFTAAPAAPAGLDEDPAAAPRPSFVQPAPSPDGSRLAFVHGGDLWTVPTTGGRASLLVSHPALDERPLWSPDGRHIAFVSHRSGDGDLYVLTLADGTLKRLTWDDAYDHLDAWTPDGAALLFTSTRGDVSNDTGVYRVGLDGATPVPVSDDLYLSEFFSTPAPAGDGVAFAARGLSFRQWWREGGAHIDQTELWLLDGAPTGEPVTPERYRQLTDGASRDLWPWWSPDGSELWFVSNRSGSENLWRLPVHDGTAGEPVQVTSFSDGRLLWPTPSADGSIVAFERDLGVWVLDVASGTSRPVTIEPEGAGAGVDRQRVTLSDGFSEATLSPDGAKLAFVARGEVFAVAASPGDGPGGRAVRVTDTAAAELQPAWAPDSRHLVYASRRVGETRLVLYDFVERTETLLPTPAGSHSPVFAPAGGSASDGTSDEKAGGEAAPDAAADATPLRLAYTVDRDELRLLELVPGADGLEVGVDRPLATGGFDMPPLHSSRPLAWSPDGRWIAVLSYGERLFREVMVVPVDGGDPRRVSFLADTYGTTLSWSPDGTFLLFDTGQRTEGQRLARIDLVPRTPRFREDLFRDLFSPPEPANDEKPPTEAPVVTETIEEEDVGDDSDNGSGDPESSDAAAAAGSADAGPEPVRIVFDGIRQRLSIVPTGLELVDHVLSPDGDQVALVGTAAGRTNLYVYPLDELTDEPAVARQLTAVAGGISSVSWTPQGDALVYLQGGAPRRLDVASGTSTPLGVTATLEVDFDRERLAVFDQAWTTLRDWFVDPGMYGVDWEATGRDLRPHAAGARSPSELRRVLRLLVGRLDASHSGVSGSGDDGPATGRLGLRFDPVELAAGRYRVAEVLPLGPAAVAGVEPGWTLTAVAGETLEPGDNLSRLLDGRIDHRTELTFRLEPPAGTGNQASAPEDGLPGAGAPDGDASDGAPPDPAAAGSQPVGDQRDRRSAGRSRTVAVSPVTLSTEKRLAYRHWVETKRRLVEELSGGRLGYVHLFNMSGGSFDQLLLDLDALAHTRDGVVIDIRSNRGGFVHNQVLDILSREPFLTMTLRGFPPTSARTVLGQRSLERPTILLTDRESLSDAEDFSEGYRTLGLGTIVGEPTASWIIYTSNVELVDGSTLRLPFVRIQGAAGDDMEKAPRPVDVEVRRPLGEPLEDTDVQLETAVRLLLEQVDGASTPGAATGSPRGRR